MRLEKVNPAVGAILLVTVGLMLSGCSAWHQKRPPGQFVTDRKPERVRVETLRGKKIELWAPTLVADSLVGQPHPATSSGDSLTAIALEEIEKLEVREGDVWKSIGLGFGILSLTFVAVGALVALTWDGPLIGNLNP